MRNIFINNHQNSLQMSTEEESPDLRISDWSNIVNIASGTDLADNQVIEEGLLEHMNERATSEDLLPSSNEQCLQSYFW